MKKTETTIDLDEDNVTETGALIGMGTAENDHVIDEDDDSLDKLPKNAVKNKDGSVTLPLSFTVTLVTKKDGQVRERIYDKLTFYRLTGADMKAIANAGKEKDVVVTFARSTRIMQAVMDALHDKMDAADIVAAGQVINHFLSSGPTTGR